MGFNCLNWRRCRGLVLPSSMVGILFVFQVIIWLLLVHRAWHRCPLANENLLSPLTHSCSTLLRSLCQSRDLEHLLFESIGLPVLGGRFSLFLIADSTVRLLKASPFYIWRSGHVNLDVCPFSQERGPALTWRRWLMSITGIRGFVVKGKKNGSI